MPGDDILLSNKDKLINDKNDHLCRHASRRKGMTNLLVIVQNAW